MKILKTIFKVIFIPILAVIFFVSSVILLDSILHPEEVPSFFGWKPFIIVSTSMEPTIMSEDVILVKEVDPSELQIGDIIAYRKNKYIMIHRIIKEEEKYEMNNNADYDNGMIISQRDSKEINNLYDNCGESISSRNNDSISRQICPMMEYNNARKMASEESSEYEELHPLVIKKQIEINSSYHKLLMQRY